MPLPQLAVEGRLGVDLELVDVDRLAEELLDRLDQPRMGAEAAEGFVVGVGGEGRPRRAGFLAPDLLAVGRVDLLGLRAEDGDLLLGEAVGEKKIAFTIEGS